MEESSKQLAYELFLKAFELQMKQQFEEAITLYERSIAIHPTAEAYTFLGWALSYRFEYEKAIELCLKAIEIDPDYGNPYNDIGSYYIHLHKFKEAIPYLEKALQAKRYEARHYAYYNLGRIYERTGEWYKAIEYYKKSIEIDPSYLIADQALKKLRAQMN